jgi:hypothetical protein
LDVDQARINMLKYCNVQAVMDSYTVLNPKTKAVLEKVFQE